jgi:hypothetical protein
VSRLWERIYIFRPSSFIRPMNFDRKFLTFIDILGSTRSTLEAGETLVKLNLVKDQIIRVKDIFLSGNVSTQVFHHCIVRVRPHEEDAFEQELIDLFYCQVKCILNKDLVRGALTDGLAFHDPSNELLLGPALLKAYGLESQVAKYPRIIVDKKTIGVSERREDFLREDPSDSVFFLDYLKMSFELLNDNEVFINLFKTHKEIILAGIFHPETSVRRKYKWLQRYHDEIVHELLKEGKLPDDSLATHCD